MIHTCHTVKTPILAPVITQIPCFHPCTVTTLKLHLAKPNPPMRMTRKLYRNPLLPLILITLLLPAAGCNYGVFGKKMAPVITHLDNTLGKSVDTTVRVIDKARADVLNTLNATRDTIFDFLKNHS